MRHVAFAAAFAAGLGAATIAPSWLTPAVAAQTEIHAQRWAFYPGGNMQGHLLDTSTGELFTLAVDLNKQSEVLLRVPRLESKNDPLGIR